MLLMLDYGIFYEFISKNDLENNSQNYISLKDVKLNVDYVINYINKFRSVEI